MARTLGERPTLLRAFSRELVSGGRRTPLTELEFDLLRYLSQHEGRAVPRDELLERVWGTAHGGASNVVDVVVSGLRRKLGEQAPALETVRGVGYRYRAGSLGEALS
jgi:two-component system alkaline phosphatase synthesis response regulator PhoP